MERRLRGIGRARFLGLRQHDQRRHRGCPARCNPRVSGYLERHHSEILTEFRAIVAATSLEEGDANSSEEAAFLS